MPRTPCIKINLSRSIHSTLCGPPPSEHHRPARNSQIHSRDKFRPMAGQIGHRLCRILRGSQASRRRLPNIILGVIVRMENRPFGSRQPRRHHVDRDAVPPHFGGQILGEIQQACLNRPLGIRSVPSLSQNSAEDIDNAAPTPFDH